MKITYTNLQENDSGVKRSVRQLRVDFERSGKEQSRLAGGGLGDGSAQRNRLPLSDAGSSGRRRAPSESGSIISEGTRGDAEETGALQEDRSRTTGGAKSVAHVLVRRFVEAQMCSVRSTEGRGIVNITI